MSNQLRIPSGSALAPTYAFVSEQSLGFYRSAASILALSYGTLQAPLLRAIASSGDGRSIVEGALTSNQAIFELRAGGTLRWDIYAPASSSDLRLYDGNDDQLTLNTSGASCKGGFLGPSGTALIPSFRFASEQSLGLYRSGASTLALSYGSFNLRQSRLVSVRTTGSLDSTTLATDEMAFTIIAGSAATLAIRSGGTIYYFTSSSSTKG